MARQLKTFMLAFHGHVEDEDGTEYRGCIMLTAQTSQKKAAEVTGVSVNEVRNYSLPGNEANQALAREHAGKVILMTDGYKHKIIEIVDHIGNRRGYNYGPKT